VTGGAVVTGGVTVIGGFSATVMGGVEVVFEAPGATLAALSTPGERAINPVFGETAAAAVLLPSGPSPQAARGRITRARRRRLRII
jgi:hypothetical protein